MSTTGHRTRADLGRSPQARGALADLMAARCLVALHDVQARGGWDVATHMERLRWSLSRPCSRTRPHGCGHRERPRVERALTAIAAGGVDARSFGELDSLAQHALVHDLTQLARVLTSSARIGSAAVPG